MLDLDLYLRRIGLSAPDLDLVSLQAAHVVSIPYENLDVQLQREVRLDVDALADKLVVQRRGGYCFEQNTLYAAVLEALGHDVVRLLGRVRLSDRTAPRPATHMVLRVGDQVVDVGFGAATPIGPVPLGGEATYGPWTWHTERCTTPEGEDAWAMWFFEMLLYTFTDEPRHPVDFVAPNHMTSTHPVTPFTQLILVQTWQDDGSQLGLIDRDLTLRRSGLPDDTTRIDPAELGAVLHDRFRLELDPADIAALEARLAARSGR